jgi:hypothetical protein
MADSFTEDMERAVSVCVGAGLEPTVDLLMCMDRFIV